MNFNVKSKNLGRNIALLTGSLVGSLLLSFLIPPLGPFEYFWQDRAIRNAAIGEVSGQVIIVAIDELSFEEIQRRWPWPRTLLAQGIERVVAGRPKVIGLDLGLWDPGFTEKEDQELARALSGVSHVLPIKFGIQTLDNVEYARVYRPIPTFRQATTRLGYVNLAPDSDNTIRGFVARENFNEEDWDSFAFALYRASQPEAVVEPQPGEFLTVRWVGPPGSIPTVSFSKVLYGEVPETLFQDKIVLFGVMFPESKEVFFTPFASFGEMYGVEIHAQWLEALLKQAYFAVPHLLAQVLIALLLFAILGAMLFFVPFPFFFPSMVLGGGLYVGFLELMGHQLWLWPATPLGLGFIILTQSALWGRYLIEARSRKRLETLFSRYVSPKIVKTVIENEEELKLGGDRKHVAIIFTDIRNFTTLSEKWSPEKIVTMLNQYFKEMCDAVFEFDGTVNKFIGDAVMAIFNAPLNQNDAARRAVLTALSMRRRLAAMNDIRIKKGESPIGVGIGIHYGEVVSGNFGSPNQMEYTVIGDTVNTASRVESLCKELKTDIVITADVYQFVKDEVEVVTHPPIQVKGRSVPIVVHSLRAWKKEV